MADTCDPQTLVTSAKCFECLEPAEREWVKIYLLQKIAGDTHTPEELVDHAKCFSCLGPASIKEVQTYLLCLIATT